MIKDFSNVPSEITIANETNEAVAVRYFLVNTVETLEPGASVTVLARTSDELAYYTKLQEDLIASDEAKELTPEDFVKLAVKFLKDEKPNRALEYVGPAETEGAFIVRFNGESGWTQEITPELYGENYGMETPVMAVAISATDYVYINLDGTLNKIEHPEV